MRGLGIGVRAEHVVVVYGRCHVHGRQAGRGEDVIVVVVVVVVVIVVVIVIIIMVGSRISTAGVITGGTLEVM
jgi:hypothetical protein